MCLLHLLKIKNIDIEIPAGGKVEVNLSPGNELTASVSDHTGNVITRINATKDEQKAAFASMCFKFRKGLDFAKPCYREDLKSMSRYFNPPLNYQSVE